MTRNLTQINTRVVVFLFASLFGITLLRYLTSRAGITLRFDNTLYGLLVFGSIFVIYQKNNLWRKISANGWVLAYCVYISLSFLYSLWRFRTPTTAVFDLWLFAYMPAVLLIPPFSFDVRIFDRILAIGVLIGFCGMAVAVALQPDALYDRKVFSESAFLLFTMAVGYVYLLLKYAGTLNLFTVIGLFGAISNALFYGVIGAFRGQLVLALLGLLLFFLLQMRSTRISLGIKFFSLSAAVVFCVAAIFFAVTRFETQFSNVMERFTGLRDRYELRGDLFAIDGRLGEAQYFRSLNSDSKLILGHGVGAVWWDFFGMYLQDERMQEGETQVGISGARSMLHTNWLHVLFKIGIVGLILLVGMIVSRNRKFGFFRDNPGWWAFLIYYLAWTTYYGDKLLTVRAIIFLLVLVNPWLFKAIPIPQKSGNRMSAARPKLSSL